MSVDQTLREETKDLSKAMNHVYNRLVFTCQTRCLQGISVNTNPTPAQKTSALQKLSAEESTCLRRCADQMMYLDNFVYETDSAMQLASTQGKPKKAVFYTTRRIEDLTSNSGVECAKE
ncbi:hypothetical protein FGO68_gene15762 [Halteria grandinella]|uniref:Mitochondrial import inner membrane translocase subunit n=1 Tax=Halteria grandinella TaxID=5974 RepID=A0A8J8P3E2_HALGN|nr:hypothetical protein FGO68_gene15762 [Halteria grandinella]